MQEFLPTLPVAWTRSALKRACQLNPEVLPETTAVDAEIDYVDIAALEGGKAEFSPKTILFGEAPSRARRVLRSGDTILSTVRTYLKAVANFPVVKSNLVASTGFAVARPNGRMHPRFTYWAMLSEPFIEAVVAHSDGVSYPAINPTVLGSLHVVVPPWAEQIRIANFLDEQTARIDALIAEKERLVERLAELEHSFGDELFRRRARERGSVRLKYRSPQITVGIVVTPAKYYVDAGIPSLRSLNVGQGELNSESLVFISPEANELHSKSKIFEGDLVVVRSGKPGAAAVVTKEFDGGNCIDLVIIRRSSQLNSDWLRAYLNSAPALEQVTDASEGAIQQHFNVSSARELRIPDSPPNEQALDLERINQKQMALRKLAVHAVSHSDRLREYRSSLVTAAVTGQLDVSRFEAKS